MEGTVSSVVKPLPSSCTPLQAGQSLRFEEFPDKTAFFSTSMPLVPNLLVLTRASDGKHYSARIPRHRSIYAPPHPNPIDMEATMCIPTERIENLLGQSLSHRQDISTINWSRNRGRMNFTGAPKFGGQNDPVLKYDPTLGTFAHTAFLCTCDGSFGPSRMFAAPIDAIWTVDLSKISPDALAKSGDRGELVLRAQDLVTYHNCSGIKKGVADLAA